MGEYAKDKPNNKTAESHAMTFVKTVNGIESSLLKQIQYLSQVSTTHPHTGSSYGAQKDWQVRQRLCLGKVGCNVGLFSFYSKIF